MKRLYLGGGCFWGMEEYFRHVKGIVETEIGYGNSIVVNPTYEEVCSGRSNAVEVLYIEYDEYILSLARVLFHFFQNIDPTSINRQGNDIGTQYRTGIYYVDKEDAEVIEIYIKEESKKYQDKIVTECMSMENFYVAERYHQDYLQKNPNGYCHNMEAIRELRSMPDYKES